MTHRHWGSAAAPADLLLQLMFPALAVANHFLKRSAQHGVVLTGAKLQALLYVAHGLRLGLVGEPLLDEPVFAGPAGISIATLNVAGAVGERPMERLLTKVIRRSNGLLDEGIPVLAPDESAQNTLNQVWERFHHTQMEALNRLICKAGAPWHSTWHSTERLQGQFAITLANTWDPIPEDERPVAIPNSQIRDWFRAAVIKDLKQRANEEGLEQTTRISRVTPGALRRPDRDWDASVTLTA